MQAIAIADAKQDLLEEFIRILDEMRLLLSHCGQNSITDGFKLIVFKMEHLLSDEGYTRVSPKVGDEFDPNIHNAIGLIKTNTKLKGKIIECCRDGWIKDGVQLRAADVKVGN